MSKSQMSVRLIVVGIIVVAISALSIAANNYRSSGVFASVREFFGARGQASQLQGPNGAGRQVATPTITEFPLPNPGPSPGPQPFGITKGPDGAMWFTERTAGKIGRITPAGIITEFPLPSATSQPNDIINGPDLNLWFTERNANKIGRITPAGVITEFTVPTANSTPFGITFGIFGDLFFTERSTNKIGHIPNVTTASDATIQSSIQEFTVPTTTSLFGIVGSLDGNAWFAEGSANKIGKITFNGAITEFTVPTASSTPFWLAYGPDNNLWFTEEFASPNGKIGRITTSGVITEFTSPITSGIPFGIFSAPDGALWFTEFNGNKIAQITTSGTITEFDIPTPSSGPALVAHDFDTNTVWFTESNGNKIVRVSLGAAPTPTPTPTPTPSPSPSPFAATLSFDGRSRDRVSKSDAGVFPDGESDGTFSLTLPAGTIGKTFQSIEVSGPNGNQWDTIPQTTNIKWVVGIATTLDNPLLNQTNGTVNSQVVNPGTYKLFVPDSNPTSFNSSSTFSLVVRFTDGTTATASTTTNKTQADVAVAFSPAPPASAAFGETVTFSHIVTNNGPQIAHGVVFIAFVDLRFDSIVVTNGIGCSVSGNTVTCNIGDVDFASNRSVRFTARAAQAGGTSSSMIVGIDGNTTFDPNSANNSIASTTTISSQILDLQLKGLEVTQGIQDLGNSVPLVAGKHTFVRAYVAAANAASAGANITGTLTATNRTTGAMLGTMANSNVGSTIPTKQSPDRGTLDDSLYFDLPANWTQGNVQFQVAVNSATLTCTEPDGTPDCKAPVTFQARQKLSVKFIGVTWTDTSGLAHSPDLSDLFQTANELLGIFPISEFDADTGATTTKLNPCIDNDFAKIKGEIAALRAAECATGPCKSVYLGLMADQSTCPSVALVSGPLNGIGTFPVPDPDPSLSWGRAALAFAARNGVGFRPGLLNPAMDFNARAHELSHCTGNHHTQSSPGFEKGPDLNYLPSSGNISSSTVPYAAATAYGFDVNNISSKRVYGPSTMDFMTYVRPRWVGVYNYKKLFSFFSLTNSNAINSREPGGAFVNQMVLVNGQVSTVADTGQLEPINVSNTAGTVPGLTPGPYNIRFENAVGVELANYSFEPSRSTEFDTADFSLALPWNAASKRILLLHNGQIITSRQASANAPVVNVTSPNGGENLSGPNATFTWTASDADGDPLSYSIEYSTNSGTTWTTLAVHWPTTSYPADLTKLAGSDQARVRVTASDGFNSSQDMSDANFTVLRRGPQVSIASPDNNQLYVGNQSIALQGTGLDAEDGFLPSANLSWGSSLSGPLGSGAALSVDASTLAEGTHTITLTGIDSNGQTGTATKTIVVSRTRPVIPSSLSLNTNGFFFAAPFGSVLTSPQTLGIRNGGDGVLAWSALADQSWIQMGAASGNAPFDMDVQINPAGLALGRYTGTITVTAAGAANSPQVVNLDLSVISVPVTIDGRVVTPDNRGLRNATVSITDSNGVRRTATTSSFGFFSFDNVFSGGNYTVRIASRLYRFSPRTVLVVSNNMTLTDFVGLE